MLCPLLLCVISRIRSLNRSIAFGAILRFSSFPPVKLNPRNFRSCGFATALFDSFTLELQLFRAESLHALHHPLPRPLAAYVDVTVVRIPHKAMTARLQLPVECVQHEVTQQRRKRTPLRCPFHTRTHQPALHHPCIQECPDELQQPLVLYPFG